jgi:hypothetical protein
MADDLIDYASLALTPEQLAEAQRQVRPKRARKTEPEPFVQLPYKLLLAAAGRRDASAAVLTELAYQRFKTHKNLVLLSNTALQAVDASRYAKLRALRRREANGAVAVWRGNCRSPLVTLLWK